jgi:hypothetical protein
VATRKYAILTDSNPSEMLDEKNTQSEALETARAASKSRKVFIQQYINGRMGESWTISQLSAKLKK